jgi:hypothetical protein
MRFVGGAGQAGGVGVELEEMATPRLEGDDQPLLEAL